MVTATCFTHYRNGLRPHRYGPDCFTHYSTGLRPHRYGPDAGRLLPHDQSSRHPGCWPSRHRPRRRLQPALDCRLGGRCACEPPRRPSTTPRAPTAAIGRSRRHRGRHARARAVLGVPAPTAARTAISKRGARCPGRSRTAISKRGARCARGQRPGQRRVVQEDQGATRSPARAVVV